MHLRTFALTLALLSCAAAASANTSADRHRDRLKRSLERSLQVPEGEETGTLADRFAGAAKTWAFQGQTRPGDFVRLRDAVKSVRGLLNAPAAARSEDFDALAAQLEPIMGQDAHVLVASLQHAMFQELVALFTAARTAEPPSTPDNGLPFTHGGKRYGWAVFEGRPIIARWGSELHRSAGVRPQPARRACPDHGGAARQVSTPPRAPSGGSVAASTPRRPTPSNPALHPSTADLPALTPAQAAADVDPRNLDGLDPTFRPKIINILRRLQAQGWQPRVASGRRTLAEQREKVRKGYSKTLKSWHLKGLAADIIDRRWGWGGEASDLNHPFWNALGQAAKAEGLKWGGDFKSFKDVAHVQVNR
jgi:hypothetical protein